ncbi:excinuclease ABC subunit UvrC [Georgenia sp. TF02-10]|uniref:excinuclease ABC subunit UvrC n=1 Tax=Georgenia sp. TF02-10 TaxID=2917725 RepID=UPI001FA7433A|nr:excinuclease ABC subunit UvrC [Georgenia sp. TF02-10]UNX56183.1 excinuclease ABC subunit UvrC [Georgenia sp. TF02-10]
MADPSTYRPRPGEVPDAPGVYRFKDPQGRVIYVGKAKSLRSRLASYFQDLSALHPRTQQMVTTAAAVEWTVVGTEVESLALEYAWIKEFDPRFNVKYRDDKSYPFLAVTMGEEVPRVQVMRGAKRKGTRYFGPYTHAWAIRDTVDQLLRVFPVRTCSPGVYRRAQSAGRPCLLGYIDKCSAPCVGRISVADHRALAEDFCRFMEGETGPYLRRVEREMRAAAGAQDYERAARLRDDAAALRKVVEQNAVVLPDGTDADVFGLAADELEVSIQVFHVRGGRIRGQRGWVGERVEELDDAGLVEHLLQHVYGAAETAPVAPRDARAAGKARARRADGEATSVDDVPHTPTTAVPREILVPALPENVADLQEWLGRLRGGRVQVRVPRRGDKRTLAETVRANAEQALKLHKARRAGDLTTRSQALRELQDALDLPDSPLRIECYDISHTQGSHQVGSMVVFEDGVPKKSEYRHFVVRGEHGTGARDDTAAMEEVLRRRFTRYLAERDADQTGGGGPVAAGAAPAGTDRAGEGTGARTAADGDPAARAVGAALVGDDPDRADPDQVQPAQVDLDAVDDDGVPLRSGPVDPASGRARRFAYPPNLVVVDGGQPQVAAAQRVLDDLGIDDVALVGLAKRLEEVWLPGEDFPTVLPRTSPALYLLQHLRDESHRFAITHHRSRRAKAMTRSVLDGVPGLGPARQAALLKAFGSVKNIRAASLEEVAAVPGMGPATARAVLAALGAPPAGADGPDDADGARPGSSDDGARPGGAADGARVGGSADGAQPDRSDDGARPDGPDGADPDGADGVRPRADAKADDHLAS